MKTPQESNYHTKVGRGLESDVSSHDIIKSHRVVSIIPRNDKEFRRMMREYYLMGKELQAYGELLQQKGKLKPDGWANALNITLDALFVWFDDLGYWNDSFRD